MADSSGRHPGISRRSALLFAGFGGLGLTGAGLTWGRGTRDDVPLFSSTVAFTGPGKRGYVGEDDAATLITGSRVVEHAERARALAADERSWLRAGHTRLISGHSHADMVKFALLDLRTLLLPGGASLAAWTPYWRYVWPRDASHVAAALSASGHSGDAIEIMRFLQRARPKTGWFEARYKPDGSGPPDDRERQLDNFGWILWAADRIAADAGNDAAAVVSTFDKLITDCARGCMAAINTADSLPPPSMDYWERHEDKTTLGTAAPLLAGLQAGSRLFRRLGNEQLRRRLAFAAARLDDAIRSRFGQAGYPRVVGGTARDASVAMLLPPYTDQARDDVVTAFTKASRAMTQTNGGLSPGEDWADDGIGWTPETALFAFASAGIGHNRAAGDWLDWLDDHRTTAGSLPEKVLFGGRPASVAPLSWTAALVVLTVDRLRR